MVGLVRFEPTNKPAQVTTAKAFKKDKTMPHVSNSANKNELTPEAVAVLRRELDESDKRRREVLASLLLNYQGEIGHLVRLLTRDARPETLHTLERMLME